jgi:FtsP/CotA-like multicopper oxidase with cupredoxin domain
VSSERIFGRLLTNDLGIDQLGTPWSDGVPGISQRPIKPGQNYLYQWNANEYGSYFYHAHHKAHIDDGLFGAIYVQPANNIRKPFDLITNSSADLVAIIQAEKSTKPIFLSDWTHLTSAERFAAEVATGLDSWCTNSILINGKGSAICLDQNTINTNTSPLILPFLNGSTYTDLGFVCPQFLK